MYPTQSQSFLPNNANFQKHIDNEFTIFKNKPTLRYGLLSPTLER